MITVVLRYANPPFEPYYEWQGTIGNDTINGYDNQTNWIYGDDGDDILSSGRGDEQDLLFGGTGSDTLKGGLGGDRLDGGAGSDLMMGGQGDDTYFVDDLGDTVIERAAWSNTGVGDTVFSIIDFSLVGTAVEWLVLSGSATIGTGNALRNNILGNDNDNILDGGRNVDILRGGAGDDTYLLRHKQDHAIEDDFSAAGGHDTVLAFNSFKLLAGLEDIRLQDVLGKTGEAVTGLTAIGNNLDNLVQGNATDNSLNGRTGNDTLTGGAGADDFIFSAALGARHADTITDFASGEDRIVIKGGLVNIGPGPLDADAFHLGAEAATAGHRFLFDGATLRYDADGSGAGAALDVAYFDGTPTLVADDIFIA